MLQLDVKFITLGKEQKVIGSEQKIKEFLTDHFEEARKFRDLQDKLRAINDFGDAEVEVHAYYPSLQSNILPEDYLTHQEEEEDRPGRD